MRFATLAACGLFVAAVTGCGDGYGGDDDDAPSGGPRTVTAERTLGAVATESADDATAATPTPQEPAAEDGVPGDDEVQAIVGSVDTAGGVISVNRISGADVERILVDAQTRIKTNRGEMLRLSQMRPSDRIVARGEADGDELRASEIIVGAGVPGAVPGG